jgi:hypothetical protein
VRYIIALSNGSGEEAYFFAFFAAFFFIAFFLAAIDNHPQIFSKFAATSKRLLYTVQR